MSLSWLVLERYALGELDADARREVERALAEDDESRACLAQIEGDQRSLRPLDRSALLAATEAEPSATERRWSWRWLLAAGPALAAALLLLALWPRLTSDTTIPPRPGVIGSRLAIKGGELAIALLRERAGVVVSDATSFRDGDRFKVLITAPPTPTGPGLSAEVLVLQDGKVYLPLPRATQLAAGNRRALPGAFSLDGAAPVDICVVAARGPLPPRSELQRLRSRAQLRDGGRWVVCRRLSRVSRPRPR
jgi:hypothetical protein